MEKMVNEDLSSTTKHAGSFEAAEQTKEVPLDPAAPEGKALRVSSTLDPRDMLLGYIVSQRGIEAHPEKVAALERMGPIRDLKGVQRVLGCLAALSRFISRLGEKGLPLYRLLKKHERFSCTAEA
jgi:hypothetical protein